MSAVSPPPSKRMRLVQTYLDVGQRVLDTVQCPVCQMVYCAGKEDAKHKRFCASQSVVQCKLTPDMDVLHSCQEDKLYIVVLPPPPTSATGRFKRLEEIVNLDLGFTTSSPSTSTSALTHFVVIRQQRAIGFLETDSAVQLASLQLSSSSSVVTRLASPRDVAFGVRRIWVHFQFRRQGLASQLVDHARRHLGHPAAVPRAQVALSQPTAMGQSFAARYFEESSSAVLVYDL